MYIQYKVHSTVVGKRVCATPDATGERPPVSNGEPVVGPHNEHPWKVTGAGVMIVLPISHCFVCDTYAGETAYNPSTKITRPTYLIVMMLLQYRRIGCCSYVIVWAWVGIMSVESSSAPLLPSQTSADNRSDT